MIVRESAVPSLPAGPPRPAAPTAWKGPGGEVIACAEKVKVLEENWNDILSMLQEALDDAVLMGVSQEQFKREYARMVGSLESGYKDKGGAPA